MFKTVELATKPKRAPPKAKYIDPIIQATFNNDGSLQDIVKAISTRLRDGNTTVVFKALIVCHQLLRAGSLETTFSYLASSSLPQQLMQQDAPNLHAYGMYLAARIKSYSNIKRDIIRDKSDRRASSRLRNLSVDNGLLRETREVQRMIAALVESKFYSDDVDDQVSMTALRFLVKDLLVLFTAVNEGVINVLEHYFEMSHVDATTALKIYKTFCRDTEKVVAYLGIAKKLQNVTNIPIPNLKHAPVSLAKSLEEYLNDPNFEKNREEYQENKRIADGLPPKARRDTSDAKASGPTTTTSGGSSLSTTTATGTNGKQAPQAFADFFESIEQSQTSMFDPSTNAPTLSYFHQQAAFNPFMPGQTSGLPMVPQITGMPAFGAVGGQPNPFGAFPLMAQPTGFMPNVSMSTGPSPFLQPQMTGAVNPFRQSMMMTGMQQPTSSPFGVPPPMSQPGNGPFGQVSTPMQTQSMGAFTNQQSSSPFGQPQQQQHQQHQQQSVNGTSPFGQVNSTPFGAGASSSYAPPGRVTSPSNSVVPSSMSQATSAPFSQPSASSAPAALVPQKTGARNPFAPAPGTVLPHTVPEQAKAPSMNALAQQAFGRQQQQQQQEQTQEQQAQTQPYDHFSSIFGQQNSGQAPQPLTQTKTGLMGNIASEFAFGSTPSTSAAPSTSGGVSSSPFGQSTTSQQQQPNSSLPSQFSSLSISTNPTGSGAPFHSGPSFAGTGESVSSPLTPQRTGFAGSTVKPFQPTSDFGAKLAGELGGGASGGNFGTGPVNSFNSFGSNVQQTSGAAESALATSLSDQTGFNPFRNTTLQSGSSSGFQPPSNAFSTQQQVPMRTGTVLPPLNSKLSDGLKSSTTPNGGVGVGPFGSGFGTSTVGTSVPGTNGTAQAGGLSSWTTFGGAGSLNNNGPGAGNDSLI
ncbi:hypothetical protein ACM66B_000118 [Microbotryomycetes sp. NB124-2]